MSVFLIPQIHYPSVLVCLTRNGWSIKLPIVLSNRMARFLSCIMCWIPVFLINLYLYLAEHVFAVLRMFLIFHILICQISRSIGDLYLKNAEYNKEPLYAKFRLREPFTRPILSADPAISVHELQPHDQFLILASDGLWEHLSNQEAVDIVQNSSHKV